MTEIPFLVESLKMFDENETTEAPKAIKGVDKETVHRICSGQVKLKDHSLVLLSPAEQKIFVFLLGFCSVAVGEFLLKIKLKILLRKTRSLNLKIDRVALPGLTLLIMTNKGLFMVYWVLQIS